MVFWLALFAMICWGVAPVFAKMGLSNVEPLPGLIARTIVASVFILSCVGFNDNVVKIRDISFMAWIFIGVEAILAALVGDLAYYAAIKKGNVSMVSVIMASSPLVTMLVSIIFLGEEITMLKVVGAGLVVVGIMMIL